ncbi:hypothetical protein PC121_g16111 [Phytophthora cactorum]|nr:hypothetical protein PC121_g16111 [Phytophthora cactorum]
MPFVSTDSSSETSVKYAVLSLMLFKHFRAAHDLIGDSDSSDEDSWIDVFESWTNTRSKIFIVIMDNMNDYYSGLQKAEVQSKAAKAAQPKNDGDDGSSSDDNDDLFGAGENIDFDDDIERARDDDEEFILMWEENNDASTVLNSLPDDCPLPPSPTVRLLLS